MKILFVCLGNICRSPTAQAVCEKMLADLNLNHIKCDSAGTGGWHAGALPDPRSRKHAKARGYELTHLARKIEVSDTAEFDLILAMDDSNIHEITNRLHNHLKPGQLKRLTDYSSKNKHSHVPDPYQGGPEDFELVLDIVEDCCRNLVKTLPLG